MAQLWSNCVTCTRPCVRSPVSPGRKHQERREDTDRKGRNITYLPLMPYQASIFIP